MKPHGEKFLAPALPFAVSGQTPTGKHASDLQSQIETARGDWQNQCDPKVLVGRGSQNIPLLAAACGLGFTYEREPDRYKKALDGWRGYLTLPWWANEPGSRDIYGCWITTSILVAYAFSLKSGDQELTDGLRKLIRSTAAILGLGAGWVKVVPDGKTVLGPGYPVTICGARSVDVTKRATPPGGEMMSRKDQDGRAYRINFIFDQPLNGMLQGLIDTNPPPSWPGDVVNACKARLGVNPLTALTAQERALLQGLVEASTPSSVSAADLVTVQSWLTEGPRPKAPFHLVKTTNGTATVCEKGVNPGSTNPMYAYVWWAKEPSRCRARHAPGFRGRRRRGNRLACRLRPTDRGSTPSLPAFDMASRVVRAQRDATKDYFDDKTLQFVPGEKTIQLPDGEVLWHFRLTPDGVQSLA